MTPPDPQKNVRVLGVDARQLNDGFQYALHGKSPLKR